MKSQMVFTGEDQKWWRRIKEEKGYEGIRSRKKERNKQTKKEKRKNNARKREKSRQGKKKKRRKVNK